MEASRRGQRHLCARLTVLGLALTSLPAVATGSALAAGSLASVTLSGALHATGTGACTVRLSQGDHTVGFTPGVPAPPGQSAGVEPTVSINEFKSAGAVNLAKTHGDFASVDEVVGGKTSMWVAGWSGASAPGAPSSLGPDLGSGTLHVSAANFRDRQHQGQPRTRAEEHFAFRQLG